MTIRSVILGILAASLIAALCYLNDWVLRLYFLVANHLPVSVFGLVLLVVLIANPLLSRLARPWGFDRRELAVMISLALIGGGLGGAGLFRNFPAAVISPLRIGPQDRYWQRLGIVEGIPRQMLPVTEDPRDYDRTISVLNGGLRPAGGGRISFEQIPWDTWQRPLRFWLPLIVCVLGGSIALGVVLHRQWAHHELLRYPIAEFAGTLIDTDGRAWPAVLRRRGFWIALLTVLSVHVLNGLRTRYPGLVYVDFSLDLTALQERWPTLGQSIGGADLVRPTFYISAAAFVMFMRSDVALSLGISGVAMAVVSAMLISWGKTDWGSMGSGGYRSWTSFGSYLGLAIVVLYSGRHYYLGLLGRVTGLARRGRGDIPPYAVWAGRTLLACMGGVIGLLVWVGCSWTMALLFVLMLLILLIVLGRVSAETGLFHLGLVWAPTAVLFGLLGAAAVGPTALLVIALVSAALLMDPREAMLPFVLNSLRLCEQARAPLARTARWMGVTLLVALAVGLCVVMWTFYNYGQAFDDFPMNWVPNQMFTQVARNLEPVQFNNELEASLAYSPLQRLAAAKIDPVFVWSAGIGLALVLLTGAARLRWTWWPIHPVLFVVAGTWAMGKLAPSIFVGYLIRSAVVAVGGGGKLEQARVIAIGAIAGDILGALLFMLAGAAYYALTGTPAPIYNPYTG